MIVKSSLASYNLIIMLCDKFYKNNKYLVKIIFKPNVLYRLYMHLEGGKHNGWYETEQWSSKMDYKLDFASTK